MALRIGWLAMFAWNGIISASYICTHPTLAMIGFLTAGFALGAWYGNAVQVRASDAAERLIVSQRDLIETLRTK